MYYVYPYKNSSIRILYILYVSLCRCNINICDKSSLVGARNHTMPPLGSCVSRLSTKGGRGVVLRSEKSWARAEMGLVPE